MIDISFMFIYIFCQVLAFFFFFFSSRRRHTRSKRDWSSDVCSSDLDDLARAHTRRAAAGGRDHLVHDGGDPVGSGSRFRRSEEHTSELQSRFDLVCRLLLEKKKNTILRKRSLAIKSRPICTTPHTSA